MKTQTREKYNKLLQNIAALYQVNIENVKETFAIVEPVEQKMNDYIMQSSDFLSKINVLPVTDKHGQILELGIASPIAKRTDTANADRVPHALGAPTGQAYTCQLTEFDTAITYATLDAWARFADFQQRYARAVYDRIARDRTIIGFYGTSAATVTNSGTNTMLEDVNIGWLKLLETANPTNYLLESTAASGKITLGASGDYKTLDQLAFDVYSMIASANLTGKEVVMVGRGLVAHDMGKALSIYGQRPTEKNEVLILNKMYGGLPAYVIPNFPDNGLLVSDPKNLHLYYQSGAMRRHTMDNPRRSQVEDFISSNDAYAFGHIEAVAAISAAAVELS